MEKEIGENYDFQNIMDPFFLILGPCSIQSYELCEQIIDKLIHVKPEGYEFIFKASFDKANRTSISGSRGIGLEKAIDIWSALKMKFPDIKLTTDFHECWQVERLCNLIDIAQIPAFLCRQTDLIIECAKSFRVVNVKKGQWLGPKNLAVSVDKIKTTNSSCQAWITDRGSNFGYHDLFVNFGIVDELKYYYDKVFLDCTHSTQRARSVYGSQGDPILAQRYFLSSQIFNYDGLFAEIHPNPCESVSDADCIINLKYIDPLLKKHKSFSDVLTKQLQVSS